MATSKSSKQAADETTTPPAQAKAAPKKAPVKKAPARKAPAKKAAEPKVAAKKVPAKAQPAEELSAAEHAAEKLPMKEQPIAAAVAARPVRASDKATERGDLFFFYRPDVDDENPHGLADVRRFHVVLRPEAGDIVRIITVGRKTLPNSASTGANHWAFVDRVFSDPEELKESLGGATYTTDTTGERHLPEARPAGEGVYALVQHGRDSVLAYALELPEELGEVQQAFGIERQGRFVVSIKNPGIESPQGLGLEPEQQGQLPEELQSLFGSRRWHPADPPALLNHEGIELILIGGRIEPDADLGIELDPQPEDEEQAEVFRDLHLDRSERSVRPLFEGKWA